MKIALDIGHMGKTLRPLDRGAVYKGARESDYVLLYAIAARGYLEKAGHNVYILCYDNYGARQEFCKINSFDLHIQCHLNAGKGDYSLIYCRENEKAEKLAEKLAEKFKQLPVSKVTYKIATKETRGYECMMQSIPSLLLEPLFLDNDNHYEAIINGNACFTIGKLVAEGILEWIDNS
jgi:N-acetylmuramoyl-L-alanine amidase